MAEIAVCARAHWKIEIEPFNVLKNKGCNLPHHFEHGKNYLAQIFANMNLLALAFHSARDCMEARWPRVRQTLATRSYFFRDFHVLAPASSAEHGKPHDYLRIGKGAAHSELLSLRARPQLRQ